MPKKPEVKKLANEIGEESNADILVYNGQIARDLDRDLILKCRARRRRENLLLLLVTEGGDPDAAYRISRCFQTKYKKFSCCLAGYCKSAGTLVVLGAHEVIAIDNGEIGPIDVQMAKRDELWEMESGQVVMTSLATLQEKAFLSFEHFFLTLKRRGGRNITLRTSAEVATKLTTGLFAELYKQIEPKHIGEAGRAMSIAYEYGVRLRRASKNFSLESLDSIVSGYPSHGFVIDPAEMRRLFTNVRPATSKELSLIEELGPVAYEPVDQNDEPCIEFLNDELKESKESEVNAQKSTAGDSASEPRAQFKQAAAASGAGPSSDGHPVEQS